ncbi:MAG: OsmC family protein [Candidatus Bathyarchaeia archaeon]
MAKIELNPVLGKNYWKWKEQLSGTPGDLTHQEKVTVNYYGRGGIISEAKARQFTVVSDEEKKVEGTDTAPNPLEYLLAGVGFCLASTIAIHASAFNTSFDSLEIDVSGKWSVSAYYDLVKTSPGFREINIEIRVNSSDDESKIRKLIEISQDHCPGINTLLNPPTINAKAIMNGSTSFVTLGHDF